MTDLKSELTTLFADVVDSVMIYDRLGDDAGAELIAGCIDRFRSIVDELGGAFIKSNGDDIMCTFPEPSLASQAACAMHLHTDEISSNSPFRVAIRAGFQHGPVRHESDGDIRGDSVNVAARLSNYAKAGQIVTSEQTLNLIPEMVPNINKFRKLESVRLKGKAERVSICEIIWKQDFSMTVFASDIPEQDPEDMRMVIRLGDQSCVVNESNFKVTIGRDPASSIRVKGKRASRHHATIEFIRGKFMLIDVSTNATYLRQRLEETRLHRDRTQIIGTGQLSLGVPFDKEPEEVIDLILHDKE